MTCKEINALLSPFLDNELSEDEMTLVQEHINTCSNCQRELNNLRELQSILSSLEDVPVPAEFDTRLHEALVIEGNKIRNSKLIPFKTNKAINWRRISSLAAVFIVGLFSVILYNNNSDDFNQQELLFDKMEAQSMAPEEANPNNRSALNDDNGEINTRQQTEQTEEITTKGTENKTQMKQKSTPPEDVPNVASIDEQESGMLRSPTPISDEMENSTYQLEINDRSAIVDKELQGYLNMLNEILIDKNFEVISYTKDQQTGIWTIDIVIITTNVDGIETKENAIYCGQDGTIWKKDL